MKIENSFAMHLSGVLEKMTYQEGINFLEGLYDEPVYAMNYFRKLEETNGYKYACEYDFIVTNKFWANCCSMRNDYCGENGENLLRRNKIQSVSFKIYLNPTSEEMLKYLYGDDMLDEEDETSEEDLVNEFEKNFFNSMEVDEYIFECVNDIETYWDVIIDEKGHYYR